MMLYFRPLFNGGDEGRAGTAISSEGNTHLREPTEPLLMPRARNAAIWSLMKKLSSPVSQPTERQVEIARETLYDLETVIQVFELIRDDELAEKVLRLHVATAALDLCRGERQRWLALLREAVEEADAETQSSYR
jgi:hypothetical protein